MSKEGGVTVSNKIDIDIRKTPYPDDFGDIDHEIICIDY